MNSRPRQETICYFCNEQFSFPLPQPAVDHFKVNCPYCDTECMVDFKPYAATKAVFRQGNAAYTMQGYAHLPKIIRSEKPEVK